VQDFHDAESPAAKLVLIYLFEYGPATPREIADDLDLPLITVLSLLGSLDGVRRDGGRVRIRDEE